MRRLDLYPRKKLRNPARHLRALESWSRTRAGFFPSAEMTRNGRWFEKIPIFQKVVAPPHGRHDLQRKCAQAMIDAAERVRDARPAKDRDSRVYAFLSFPDMFDSFIEVAFDSKPTLFFEMPEPLGRKGDDAYWREYFNIERGQFHDLGLRIPDGFEVQGTGLRTFDADWMTEPQTGEHWAVGELRRNQPLDGDYKTAPDRTDR